MLNEAQYVEEESIASNAECLYLAKEYFWEERVGVPEWAAVGHIILETVGTVGES